MISGGTVVQNDFNNNSYTEKFLLIRGENKNECTLKIVCGPYNKDFQEQEKILHKWAEKIKELSEY